MDPVHILSAVANIATSSALAIAGLFALLVACRPPDRRALPRHLALACAAGLVVLALDEGLELHDRIGRWLYNDHGVVSPGPINHVDDLFVIAYVGAGALVMLLYFPTLWRQRRFFFALLASGALIAAGTAFDALGTTGTWTDAAEETFEVAGAIVLAAAFAFVAVRPGALVSEQQHLPQSPPRGISKGGARELESNAPQPESRSRLRPM